MAQIITQTRSWSRRLAVRLVAAMLLVALPLVIVEAWLLTSRASSSLTTAAKNSGGDLARAVTLRVEDWLVERRESMVLLAATAAGAETGPSIISIMKRTVNSSSDDYSFIQLTDVTGKVLSSTDPRSNINPAGAEWFRTAASGQSSLTTVMRVGNRLQWLIAQPIVGRNGKVEGVAVANMRPEILTVLLNPELQQDRGGSIAAIDTQGKLIYSTDMKKPANDTALIEAGSLTTVVDNAAVRAATKSGEPGTVRFTDSDGKDAIGGFDVLDGLGWVIVAQEPAIIGAGPGRPTNAGLPCCSSQSAACWSLRPPSRWRGGRPDRCAA